MRVCSNRSATVISQLVATLYLSSVLGGCAGSGTSPVLPSWYITPPQETGFAFGVGEGVTGREAAENARLDLAGQIRARVSSEIRMFQEHDGDYYRSIFNQGTEQTVSNVALVGATIVRQEKRGRAYYALISLDTRAIVIQQESEVVEDARFLRELLDQPMNASFDAWWKLTEARNATRRLAGNLTLLQVLGSEKRGPERQLLERHRRAIERAGQEKNVRIIDDAHIDDVREMLAQQLEREGVHVVGGRRGARLALSAEYPSERLNGGDTYINATLWVRLWSSRDGLLAEFPVHAQVVSMDAVGGGQRKAERALYVELRETLSKTGLIDRLVQVGGIR